MSKITLAPDILGTATFTIAAPDSSTDRTLTLPDNSGTLLSNASTAGFPAGSVLQVVSVVSTSGTAISTQTETAITGMSASITPSSSTSKVLVTVVIGELRTPGNVGARFQLYKNGAKLRDAINELGYGSGTSFALGLSLGWSFLDSPATTSATTYAFYGRKLLNNAGSVEIMPNGISTSSVILMEIAA